MCAGGLGVFGDAVLTAQASDRVFATKYLPHDFLYSFVDLL